VFGFYARYMLKINF